MKTSSNTKNTDPKERAIRILFVCHGNICRSVMGQWILEDLLESRNLGHAYEVDSAAVSREETGHSIYPAARAKLLEKGIPVGWHQARVFTRKDYEYFDHIYVMDNSNLRHARQIAAGDPARKIELLLGGNRPIDDPWYTDDFETAFRQIASGCRARLEELEARRKES